MKKNNVLLFSLIFLFAIVAQFVLGANLIDNVLQPFKGIDIGATYLRYASIIDAILYFWFFISLAKGIFKEKFPTSVATVLGIILGIGMGVFEYTSHFNLGMLAPIAAIIFFITFGTMVFIWIKGLSDDGALAFSLAFILFYGVLQLVGKSVVAWINKIPMLATILGVLTLIAIVILIMRGVALARGIKFGSPSKSERKDVETSFPNQEKPLEQAEEVTKKLEPLAKDDPGEADLIKEEEGVETFDEYKMVFDTEANNFARQIITLIGRKDLNAEQKEKEMLNAINAYTDNINNELSKMKTEGVIDQGGRELLIQNLKGISAICQAMAQRKQQENIERGKDLSALNDDVQKINDVVKHFQIIDKGLSNLTKKTNKDIGKTFIGKITAAIDKKKDDLAKARKLLEESKRTVGYKLDTKAVDDLDREIAEYNKVLEELKNMRNGVQTLTDALQRTIKNTQTEIKNIDAIEKRVNTQNSNTQSFLKNFDKEIKNIQKAATTFQKNTDKLGQKTESVENIPIAAITHIGEIYSHLITMEVLLKTFYENDIGPFVNEIRNIDVYSSNLNVPIDQIGESIRQIMNTYDDMKQKAEKLLEQKLETKKTQESMRQIAVYMGQIIKSQRNATTMINNQTITALNNAQTKIKDDIIKINTEIYNLTASRKSVIDKLTQALHKIVDQKSRVSEEFKQGAQTIKQNMAQAAAKVGEPVHNDSIRMDKLV